MAYQRFMFRPLQHGLDVSQPSLNAPFPYAYWPSKNFKITQRSAQKRWGYNTADRDLGDNVEVQAIVLYQLKSGTSYTLYLTPTDLIKKETASGKTWSYVTETLTYTSLVTSISGTTVTLKAGETPNADGVADGDYFILIDDYTSAEEPHRVVAYDAGDDGTGDTPDTGDTVTGGTSGATGKIKLLTTTAGTWVGGDAAGFLILTKSSGLWIDDEPLAFTDGETAVVNGTETATWASIASSEDTGRTITLDSSYPGSTGSWGGSEKTGYVRRIYTTPDNERWTWAIIDDMFIFTNGNTLVQKWTGTYASNLNASYAIKARYCISYANRLFIADHGTTRDPLSIAWSKEGDPEDWTESTAGSGILIESKDFITGLGVVGGSLVIYKADSIAFGHRTGVSSTPVSIPQTREKRGVGVVAPYSIIDFMGTSAFIGRNDFYIIEGDYPKPIGGKIRDKFFDIVGKTEIKKVFGFENNISNEICWLANTSEGRLMFSYDYKIQEWNISEFAGDLVVAGKGGV